MNSSYLRGAVSGLALASAVLTVGAAQAQATNLEDLQKQLDQAKKAKEASKASKAQQKPAPAVAPAAPKEAAAAGATPNRPSGISPGSARIVEAGPGQLRDTVTGLIWTQEDNGGNIAWDAATKHCGRIAGWRLPSVSELRSLHAADHTPVACGEFKCRVPGLFRLTGGAFWSNEADGPSRARFVTLGYGDVFSDVVGYSAGNRALCVRRS